MSSMPLSFNAGSCDLCGSDTSIPLLDSETDQSLRSDRCIISRNLRKSTCVKCGLVRSSLSLSAKELRQYYRDDYTLSCQPEHLFYAPVGQLSRSQAICDWILTETGLGLWRQAKRVLEIGAGSGSLLQQFIRRFPRTSFEGIELGRQAGAVARSRNLKVHTAFKDLKETDFDLVYAVGVIEHVPSPARFLEQMRGLLGKEGRLVLCQPTQDVSGYDLFFSITYTISARNTFGSTPAALASRKRFAQWDTKSCQTSVCTYGTRLTCPSHSNGWVGQQPPLVNRRQLASVTIWRDWTRHWNG